MMADDTHYTIPNPLDPDDCAQFHCHCKHREDAERELERMRLLMLSRMMDVIQDGDLVFFRGAPEVMMAKDFSSSFPWEVKGYCRFSKIGRDTGQVAAVTWQGNA